MKEYKIVHVWSGTDVGMSAQLNEELGVTGRQNDWAIEQVVAVPAAAAHQSSDLIVIASRVTRNV